MPLEGHSSIMYHYVDFSLSWLIIRKYQTQYEEHSINQDGWGAWCGEQRGVLHSAQIVSVLKVKAEELFQIKEN